VERAKLGFRRRRLAASGWRNIGCKKPSTEAPPAGGTMQSSAAPVGDAKKGRTDFAQFCAGCHGAEGKGDGPNLRGSSNHPPDFTNQRFASMAPDKLSNAIKNGKPGGMPAFGNRLSNDQVNDLVATIQDFSKYGK
jgi:mono/diheme cytochrome c family protein